MSRRRLLNLGLLAAGATAVTSALGSTLAPQAVSSLSDPAGTIRPHQRHGSSAHTDVAVETGATAPPHRHRPHEPHWVHTWHEPISRIDDFTARSRSTHFSRHAIMLTIDDGPDPDWTPKYLRLLAKHHVQATFNVIGSQVLEHPKLVRALATEGHHIGNHTFHHPLNLPSLSADSIRRELEHTTDAIVHASGFRPRQFRAPGGVWGPDVFAEVSRQQMMPLGWDIDPRDWALPGVTAIRSAMLAARPHDIILCHDGGGDRSETYHALETVIPALLARGYTFVTLPAPAKLT
jgi:peptidoglycan/xylan/chitin deacetylase (PgdA/CDA1 family)